MVGSYIVCGFLLTEELLDQLAAKWSFKLKRDSNECGVINRALKKQGFDRAVKTLATDWPKGRVTRDGGVIDGSLVILLFRRGFQDPRATRVRYDEIKMNKNDHIVHQFLKESTGMDLIFVTIPDPYFQEGLEDV